MRRVINASLFCGLSLFMLAGNAAAGGVANQFRSGAFGLPWSANKAAIQAKYPGGTWDKDEEGRERYCAPSRQVLLKLPAPHQTRELCFLMGGDNTMGAASARLDPSLPSLLAVVNRSRTMFGDFDAVKRDEGAIQSKYTNMLWLKDAPIIVVVSSANGPDGKPEKVVFSVADEASLFAKDADKVSNAPPPSYR
jgi:hypothetical protein